MNCPKCRKPMSMLVQATLRAPARFYGQFSKSNLRSKEVYFMGVNWETADLLCPDHGLVRDGYGNYVTKMRAFIDKQAKAGDAEAVEFLRKLKELDK